MNYEGQNVRRMSLLGTRDNAGLYKSNEFQVLILAMWKNVREPRRPLDSREESTDEECVNAYVY